MARFFANVCFEAETEAQATFMAKQYAGYLGSGTTEKNVSVVEVFKDVAVAAKPDAIQVYTDGGCNTHKNAVGAWAFHVINPDGTTLSASGALLDTTNNRMELLAIKQALEALEIGRSIIIFSDSQYCINSLTIWGANWKKYGWKNYSGQTIKNRDLLEPLLTLVSLHDVTFQHVKGHSDNPNNNLVDALCTKSMNQAYSQAVAGKFNAVDERGSVPA